MKKVEDGWYEGIYNGRQGVFPSNYVEKVSDNNNLVNDNLNNSLTNDQQIEISEGRLLFNIFVN